MRSSQEKATYIYIERERERKQGEKKNNPQINEREKYQK